MIHAGTFATRFAGRFLEVLTPTRFVFYGSPSPEVLAATAAFSPIVMHPAAAVTR
jgi:hypothetical protein